jgi:phage N-6-adenine-methyltransferase
MKAWTRKLMFSTGRDDWETPADLFAQLNAEFRFTLDVAANGANRKCGRWLGPGSATPDALVLPWSGTCFLNPPYSRGAQHKFIAKAAGEARIGRATTVALLPARTDTKSFHTYIWDAARQTPRSRVDVRFLPGRLRFVGAADAAPFPSMVVVFWRWE